MTNIGSSVHHANDPSFSGTIPVPRRLRALYRLAALRRRHSLAAALEFADPRIQADLGLVVRHHRHDWLEAFLAHPAGR